MAVKLSIKIEHRTPRNQMFSAPYARKTHAMTNAESERAWHQSTQTSKPRSNEIPKCIHPTCIESEMSFPRIGNFANGYYQKDIWPDLPESRRVILWKGSISRNVIPTNGCSLDVAHIPILNYAYKGTADERSETIVEHPIATWM